MNLSHLFKTINPAEFKRNFSDESFCLEVIANEKWKDGFVCRKCGHNNYCKGKSPHSRRCTRCKADESATAHTIFHRCHFPITDAFEMAYLVCNTPGISSYEISRQLDTRQMTCWKFKKRITECLESGSDLHLFDMPLPRKVTTNNS